MSDGKIIRTVKYEEDKFDNETKLLPESEKQLLKRYRDYQEKAMTPLIGGIFADTEPSQDTIHRARHAIGLKVHKIKELLSINDRKNVQIHGMVYEHLEGYPDQKLTKTELEKDIEKVNIQIEYEVLDIKRVLNNMIAYIGVPRVDRKGYVLSMEEFEQYVHDLDMICKEQLKLRYGILPRGTTHI